MRDYHFEKCSPEEKGHVKVLLKNAKLPFEDIDAHYGNFILAKDNKNIIGVIGLENYSSVGLLRSLAVAPDYRNGGLGKMLVNRMITFSRSLCIKELYLLTTTADTFFKKLGFGVIERGNVPDEITLTTEFKSICPVSAICMKREI